MNTKTANRSNEKLFDLDDVGKQWSADLEELQKTLKSAMHDLTHTTIEIRIAGQPDPIRSTEIDLISGDIVITLPKDSKLSEEQINQINEKAIQTAREELEKRMEKLRQIIDALIKVLQGMVAPGTAVAQGLEIMKAIVSQKATDQTTSSSSQKPP